MKIRIPCSSILLFSLLFLFCKQSPAQELTPLVKQFVSVNADTLALIHVNIVDGKGGPAKTDQTLVIIKGQITMMGNSGQLTVPATAKIIECNGKTLIPGMVMMHEHLFYGERVAPYYLGLAMPFSFPRLYLAGGVTTMRTGGTVEAQTDLNVKKWIAEGKMAGPDIDVTAPYVERESLPIPEMMFIKNTDEATKGVNYWMSMGCTSFKAYMNITKEDLKEVVSIAHKNKMKVTGHLCSITYREAAEIGIDNLEHGFMVSTDFVSDKKENVCTSGTQSLMKLDVKSEAMKDLMRFLISKNVSVTSTLPVFEPYSSREIFPGGGDSAVVAPVKETVEKVYNSFVGKDSASAALFKKEMAWEKQFVDMGGRLMAGVDPTGAGRVIPGYADQHSLELLVEAGFSFSQAVKVCSLNAAEYLGRDKEIGSIEIGKRADLVLINGDPLKDIKAVRNTETVFKNGIGFDSKKLFESVKGKVGLY